MHFGSECRPVLLVTYYFKMQRYLVCYITCNFHTTLAASASKLDLCQDVRPAC